MAYDVLVAGIIACVFWFMSLQPGSELFRRLFFYTGFVFAILAFGLQLTGSAEALLAGTIWILSAILSFIMLVDLSILLYDTLKSVRRN